jgi:predicted secreted protein
LLWTTAVSAIVFAIFYWAFASRAVAFEDLVTLWGLLKP